MQAMLQGELPYALMAQTLDFAIIDVAPGRAVFQGVAIGQVIHCGRQLATAEGRIVDASGKVYAHATTTCLVFEMPKAA